MGLGTRVFIVDDNNSIRRVPVARWDSLHNHDPNECFPEYANKGIRCAVVILEFVDRKPVAVNRTFFSIVYFDSDGRLDSSKVKEEKRLIAEVTEPIFREQRPSNIINALSKFSRAGHKHRFKWTPSQEILDLIQKAIF